MSKNILFVGGGTLGPVTPLFAVLEEWQQRDASIKALWVGTPDGPERELVKEKGIPFISLPKARLPRYVSFEWFLFPFRFARGFIRSWQVLQSKRPILIASAGGYTSVPVCLAAFFQKIPIWVHNPDVAPLVTVRLISRIAKLVTTSFEKTVAEFPLEKTVFTGHPVQQAFGRADGSAVLTQYGFDVDKPIVLFMGGGTGAQALNLFVQKILPDLLKWASIIHLTGPGKNTFKRERGYEPMEMANGNLPAYLAAASIVVSRAGAGTISEVATVGRPLLLFPLTPSPQQVNAALLAKAGATFVFDPSVSPETFVRTLVDLLFDLPRQQEMVRRLQVFFPAQAANRIVDRLELLARS